MICYVFGRPVGDGTYTPELGFTTAGVDTLIGEVICRPDFLADVGTFSSTIDVSQAQGNAPQALKHSFALIDSDGDVRRSIGVFDGSLRLVGWQVLVYVSETNLGDPQLLDSPASFIVTEAPVNGESITINIESAWGLNLSTCAFGDGDAAVGLVAGGHEVTVQTVELDLPDPIQFDGWSDWFVGNPATSGVSPVQATKGTYKTVIGGDSHYIQFRCSSMDSAQQLLSRLTSDGSQIIARGSQFSCLVNGIYAGFLWGKPGEKGVAVGVPSWFYDFEDPKDVELIDIGGNSSAIVAGAASVSGFLDDDGRTVTPLGSYSTPSSYVTAFNPRSGSAAGFLCYTLVPCKVAFAANPSSAEDAIYYGSTELVNTDGSSDPGFDALDSSLQPTGTPTGISSWGDSVDWTTGSMEFKLKVVLDDPSVTFPRYFLDLHTRFSATASIPYTGPQPIVYRDAYVREDLLATHTSGNDLLTIERELQGAGVYLPNQTYASLDEINDGAYGLIAGMSAGLGAVYFNWQISALRLYGISSLSYGSAWAVVTPGASPWWGSALGPIQTANALANSVGVEGTFSSPSNVVAASEWGEFFEPDMTRIDAAVSLCKEFWGIIGTGENNVDATGYGEVIAPPGLALGSTEDVITLPTIEYAYWKGAYTKKAYIANVDQDFDIARQDEFFGGWDDDDSTGYGLAIWSSCRRAWQSHGFLISKNFEAPGVFNASTLGRMWSQAKRNGVARIDWLSLQPRFLTLKVRETLPTWWAGNTVKVPTAMAEFAGYDMTEFDGQALVCVSKEWDPMSLSSTFEVILPPVIPQPSSDRIIGQHDAVDRITEDHTATDRILQVTE